MFGDMVLVVCLFGMVPTVGLALSTQGTWWWRVACRLAQVGNLRMSDSANTQRNNRFLLKNSKRRWCLVDLQ
jgi:hypothetical protein